MVTAPEETRLPPSLRLLKTLVILLMLSMIGGVLAVVWLLVTRLPAAMGAGPDLPEAISLPAGESPAAVTFGKGLILVLTESERLLVFTPEGRPLREIALDLVPPSP